jgi:hypothetical protein
MLSPPADYDSRRAPLFFISDALDASFLMFVDTIREGKRIHRGMCGLRRIWAPRRRVLDKDRVRPISS